jgi:hypothetical protein
LKTGNTMQKKKIITGSLGILVLILIGVMIFQSLRYNKLFVKSEAEISETFVNVQNTVSRNTKETGRYKKQGEQTSTNTEQADRISGSTRQEDQISEDAPEDARASILEKLSKSERIQSMKGKSEEEKNKLRKDAVYNLAQKARKKEYGVFFERNNISPGDIEKVTELLAAMSYPGLTESLTSAEGIRKLENENMNNIQIILGNDNYQEFVEYKESLPERYTVENFKASLEGENQLKDDQIEPLVSAIYEARKKLYSEGAVSEKDFSSLVASKNEQYVAAAKGILTEQQWTIFKDNLEESRIQAEDELYIAMEKDAKKPEITEITFENTSVDRGENDPGGTGKNSPKDHGQ